MVQSLEPMADPTTRLHYDDPLLVRFDARVIAHDRFSGKRSIVLDRSAFYPESGGQMGDVGAIGGISIVDVQIDDDGVVHHVVAEDASPPPVGEEIVGEVDRVRRRVHMSLHTGQHMLSRALVDVANAETVSSRLGESACTIDVAQGAKLEERDVARAEEMVNAIVDDDVPVRQWFPEAAEIATLPLRRAPKVTDRIRVVSIGEFDVSPCGGTHCLRSAQVGLVRVTGVERYKGSLRVLFSAGPRARRELARHDDTLRTMARSLTCSPTDVANALDKVRRELDTTRETLGKARALLAEGAAKDLWSTAERSGNRNVVAEFADGGVEFLRAVASRIVAHSDGVALLAMKIDDGLHVLVDRGASSTFDCGAFVKRAAASAGGKGGGRPDHAEGRLPGDVDWPSLVRRLLAT